MVKIDNKNLHDADEDLNAILLDMCKNAICLCQGCNKKACQSHVISRSILALLAEKGKVQTWRRRSSEQLVLIRRKYTNIEQLPEEGEPVYVSIGSEDIHDTVTYPLFCRKHDKDLFKPIENGNPISVKQPNLEQIFLLQHRALSSIVFDIKRRKKEAEEINPTAQKHDLHKANPQAISALQQNIKQKNIYETFSQCEQIGIKKQYDQIDYLIHLLDIPDCIAATYGFEPSIDDHATHQSISLKDYMFFTLLPYTDSSKSIAIFSWLKGSKQSEKFIDLYQLRTIDKQKEQLLLQLAFESSNLYISPTWWNNTLSDQEREYYKQIRTNLGRKYIS